MYEECFVLVSDLFFGVFEISASCYPEEFTDNMNYVKKVKWSDIRGYLLEKVGRNVLVSKKYDVVLCMGKVFSRIID